jgi:uroporphyrinogen decarboxylase
MSGTGANLSLRIPDRTVEETEEYRIFIGGDGQTIKNWKHATSTPEYIDFMVKTRADWEEHKHLLEWEASRIDVEAVKKAIADAEAKGLWISFNGAFGYDRVQSLIGSERLLMAMAEDPDWVQDMFDTVAALYCTSLEAAMGLGFQFDGCFVYDDMGYRNATMFSPAMFRRFEFPNHKRVYDCAKGYGLPCILHSCGNVNAFVPGLIEAGLTCLQPLEVKAQMNLVQLKRDYGEKLAFMGGIDVRKMAMADPAIIEEEIATKIGAAKVGGGYIYHSDHSVPDNISFSQYVHVMELVEKYGRY